MPSRTLRESFFTLAKDVGSDRFDADALAILNRIAAAPAAIPSLKAEGGIATQPLASALLSLLAREAIYLLGGENAARLRQCEAPACTIYFVDISRSGDRRWCSMAACGNKVKVAEYRRRQRT